MLTFFIAYLLCGIAIGFCAGLFGIGGGIIGIPALLFLFNLQGIPASYAMHMAVGTLFATIIVTSTASIYTHYRRGMILFPLFKKIVLGTVLGSIVGITISSHLHGVYLQRIFGGFLILIALQMLLDVELKPRDQMPDLKMLFISTTFLGTISGMLGLGGGILMVPYLNWCGIPMRNAIATATVCILPAAIVGTLGYIIVGNQFSAAPGFHSGFVYLPAFLGIAMTSVLFAPLGARVTHIISVKLLRRIFSIFLAFVGLSLFIRG